MPGQGLAARERIRRRSEFERVYREGVRIPGRLMAVFMFHGPTSASRLGVAATRKLGSAVRRNRAKRLARELFRRHKSAASGLDVVIVPRPELLDASFASLERDYRAAVERRQRVRATTSAQGGRRRGARAPESV